MDRLTLIQWLSPAFPIGSFAYSHGLETAVAQGSVCDAKTAAAWIGDVLTFGAGRTDAILMLAVRGGADPAEVAAYARALAGSAERARETEDLGRAFAEVVSAMGYPTGAAPYPVAVGVAARALDLPADEVAACYLQAFATTLVSAAVRFVPLGQTEGQRILAGLQGEIARLAQEVAAAGLDDIGTAAFAGEMAAMEHETLETRIFRT